MSAGAATPTHTASVSSPAQAARQYQQDVAALDRAAFGEYEFEGGAGYSCYAEWREAV